MLDLLELKLKAVVGHYVGAEGQTWVANALNP